MTNRKTDTLNSILISWNTTLKLLNDVERQLNAQVNQVILQEINIAYIKQIYDLLNITEYTTKCDDKSKTYKIKINSCSPFLYDKCSSN